MVLVDQSHQLLEAVLSLQSLLLGLSILVSFLLEYLSLVLIAVLSLIEADLDGDQVTLHTIDHVLIGALDHHLVLVSVLDAIKSVFGVRKTIRRIGNALFNV